MASILGLTNSEVASLMGVTITGIGVVATIITLVIGGYAIYLQRTLSKQNSEEFKEKFNKILDNASENPLVLEKFIQCIVEIEEFKNRFLNLIQNEIENVLDSRQVINTDISQNDDIIEENNNIKSQFKEKE